MERQEEMVILVDARLTCSQLTDLLEHINIEERRKGHSKRAYSIRINNKKCDIKVRVKRIHFLKKCNYLYIKNLYKYICEII